MPANTQLLLGLPGSTTAQRASFATKSLWVTPYDEEQLYPGGMYPLQNIHTGGLAEWTKQVGLLARRPGVVRFPYTLMPCPILLCTHCS